MSRRKVQERKGAMSKDERYIKMINSRRWQRLRQAKINRSPLCELCKLDGIMSAAQEVHHMIPVESVKDTDKMERLMFDMGNLQSLCHDHHVEVHKLMQSHSKAAAMRNNEMLRKRFEDKYF